RRLATVESRKLGCRDYFPALLRMGISMQNRIEEMELGIRSKDFQVSALGVRWPALLGDWHPRPFAVTRPQKDWQHFGYQARIFLCRLPVPLLFRMQQAAPLNLTNKYEWFKIKRIVNPWRSRHLAERRARPAGFP